MRILIFLSLVIQITKQSLVMPYIDSLFDEIPYYDNNFNIHKCENSIRK
jgi:hypothetical protein